MERAYAVLYLFKLVVHNNNQQMFVVMQGPVLIGSSRGGVNIEAVAKEDPTAIITEPVDIDVGLSHAQAVQMAGKIGFSGNCREQVTLNFISSTRFKRS